MPSFLEGLAATAVVIVVHAAILFAQAPPYLQPGPEANQTISGTVVNSVTGDPVRRALVQLGGQCTLTDGDGHFEFRNLPQVQGYLSVRKPGFFNEQELAPGQVPQNLMVQTGPDAHPLIAKLTPEAVVSGRIESESGPIEGRQVSLLASRIRNGARHWEQQGTAITNDDGAFRIANLLPGAYYLALAPSWDGSLSVPGNPPKLRGYPESYYPGVPDISAATALEAIAGQQVEADMTVKFVPAFEVSGTVIGFNPGTSVSFQFANKLDDLVGFPTNFDDENGNFRTRLPAGSYTLQARGQSPDGALLALDFPLELAGDVHGIKLPLSPSPPIPVNVHFVNVAKKSSKVIAGFSASGTSNLVNVQLEPAGPTLRPLRYFAVREPSGEQKLALKDVDPGKYKVNVQSGYNWYVASVHCGDTDLLQDPLEIHSGIRLPPIDVELRNDGSSLRASVSSDGTAAGWVLLLPARSAAEAQAQPFALSDQAIFQDLPPGEYSVLAFDDIAGLEYKNSAVMSEYLGQATQVVLSPQQEVEIKLKMVHREK